MIPNKTEEQILIQYFKYYDLEGSGFCNLRNFIKSHERLGVVLSKIKDIEEIFNEFDVNKTGIINYKTFAHNIFTPEHKEQTPKTDSFQELLEKTLIAKGGALALVNLIKEIQIIDYNNSRKISIDDFVKVSNECQIGMNQNEYTKLFQSYEIFSNGIVLYGEMINRMLNKYWNDNRAKFANDLYGKLKGVTFNDIKSIYNRTKQDQVTKINFSKFVDCFKFITKTYGGENPIKVNEFKDFVKHFGFGIDSDQELAEILIELDEQIEDDNKINTIEQQSVHESNMNSRLAYAPSARSQTPSHQSMKKSSSIEQLGKLLRMLNRRTLFNFIKHFKYYENESHCITKYDFMKVLKDYRINLPLLEVEQLYIQYAVDAKKTLLNYRTLFDILIESSNYPNRKSKVESVFNYLYAHCQDIHEDFTIDYVKSCYLSKNNYLNNDEVNNKTEFDEIIELFHYCYKGQKYPSFQKEEFIEFYGFISLLVENDNDFISMIEKEFNSSANTYTKKEENNKIEQISTQQKLRNNLHPTSKETEPKSTYNYMSRASQQQPQKNLKSPIETLTSILLKRGVRGLLYLHRQFVLSCPEISKISVEDFIKVLSLQGIRMSRDDIETIFNMYQHEGFLDFFGFIRTFKKELNENKLSIVERAFSVLDVNQNEQIDIDALKMKYDPMNHPDVIKGKKNDEEELVEFYDCFEVNFSLLATENNQNDNNVNFEIFANFYEYVAFVYDNDAEFEAVVSSTWKC